MQFCKAQLLDKTGREFYNILRCMNKLEFMRLWDLYGGLLTPNQREMTGLYFNFDLTVTEIAEQKGVTRQAVSECLSQCKRQLEEYENTLHHDRMLSEGDLRASFMMTKACRWADDFLSLHPEYAADIGALKQILQSDYAEEIASAMEKSGKTSG